MLLILFNLLPSLESLFQSSLSAGLCHEILLQSSVPQRNPLPQVWLILQPPGGEHTSMHCTWIRISGGGSEDKVREDHSGNLMSLLSWGGHLGRGDHDEWVELKSVGKGRFMHAVFWPPLGHIKMDLGPEPFPYQEIKSPHGLCWFIACVGTSFPVSNSVCALLFGLSLCNICHLVNSSTVSVLHGEGTESLHCSMKGVQKSQ